MSVVTEGEEFAKLIEWVRKAQESAATLAHLNKANGYHGKASQWLQVSENFKKINLVVTQVATSGLH